MSNVKKTAMVANAARRSPSTGAPVRRSKSADQETPRGLSGDLQKKKHRAEPPHEPQPSVAPAPKPSLSPVPNALVFVGSYHNLSAAYQVRKTAVSTKFTSASHVGSVVCVAACSRFVVSSGADESLSIQSIKEHGSAFTDLGKVAPPSQINAMAFPDPRFLVCAADDGKLIVYKTREWTCAAVIDAHERAAVGVAVHPTGVLAVSVGLDCVASIVDLVRGVVVVRKKLEKILGAPVAVHFSGAGDLFVVQFQYAVCVFDTATATEVARATFDRDPPKEISCIAVTSAIAAPQTTSAGMRTLTVIAAVECGALIMMTFVVPSDAAAAEATNSKAPSKLLRPTIAPIFGAQLLEQLETVDPATSATRRIRAIQMVDGSVFAATSSGDLRVFDIAQQGEDKVVSAVQRLSYAAGGRLTSLAVLKRTG